MEKINEKECRKPTPVMKKRAGDDQKKALLTYLEENLPVARNQFEGSEGYKKLMAKWTEAADTLNEHGPAKKTGPQWKKFFEDWRIRTKKKYSAIKQRMEASGQNGVFIDHLNDLEQKLVAIVTLDSIDGDGITEELGLSSPSNTPQDAPSSESSTSAVLHDESNDSATSGSTAVVFTGGSDAPGTSGSQHSRKKRHVDEEMELLEKMAKIEERRFELDTARDKREEKAEERASEEHTMKMEMYKAKLSILEKQVGNTKNTTT